MKKSELKELLAEKTSEASWAEYYFNETVKLEKVIEALKEQIGRQERIISEREARLRLEINRLRDESSAKDKVIADIQAALTQVKPVDPLSDGIKCYVGHLTDLRWTVNPEGMVDLNIGMTGELDEDLG